MSQKVNYCPQIGKKVLVFCMYKNRDISLDLTLFWVKMMMMYCCFCSTSHLFHKINRIMDCHNSPSSVTGKKNR